MNMLGTTRGQWFCSDVFSENYDWLQKCGLCWQGAYQSNTTFAQIRQMLEWMKKDGVDRITTQLVDWNAQGHDGR